MPAVSRKQQQAMAIAEHEPGKLYKRNNAMASMSKEQLSEFTSTKGLSKDQKKSTKGSPEFTDADVSQGYRKL